MQRNNHGNATCISYRFHEMPTGKVFVFCTDHEDEVAISQDFRRHLKDADLAIMDGQYDHQRYMKQTARFGHGTPHGVIKNALIAGVRRIGITHHDPRSTDQFLREKIIPEAIDALIRMAADEEFRNMNNAPEFVLMPDNIFLCHEYMEVEV